MSRDYKIVPLGTDNWVIWSIRTKAALVGEDLWSAVNLKGERSTDTRDEKDKSDRARAAKEQVLRTVKTSDGICICTDSWTNIRHQQIMAFVMITSDRKALPHRSFNTSAERHFAETALLTR
ncbi:hypothetical protein WJX77_005052 [Trebouxia sp. C0004]